jgi:hypothetical protein
MTPFGNGPPLEGDVILGGKSRGVGLDNVVKNALSHSAPLTISALTIVGLGYEKKIVLLGVFSPR